MCKAQKSDKRREKGADIRSATSDIKKGLTHSCPFSFNLLPFILFKKSKFMRCTYVYLSVFQVFIIGIDYY